MASSKGVAKKFRARLQKSSKVIAAEDDIAALGNQIAAMIEGKRKKEKNLIHPNGKFCQIWDPLMFMLLWFIAFSTPFEIAFISDTKVDFMFGLNRFFDLLFLFDIVVNFNVISSIGYC